MLKTTRLGGMLALIMDSTVGLLPIRTGSRMMSLIMGAMSPLFLNEKAINLNLQRAFPNRNAQEIKALRRGIARNFGHLLTELVKIEDFREKRGAAVLRITGDVEYLYGPCKRAVYVTGHFGNWELLPLVLHRADVPTTIVYSVFNRGAIDRLLQFYRRHTGGTYVEKSQALRRCIQALQNDEAIGLLADQRADMGHPVSFFGRRTTFTHVPARMAIRFKCPIIVVESFRTGLGEVEARLHPPIWADSDADGDPEKDMTQRMATLLEECISRHPDQWFCNKLRWKKSIDGNVVETVSVTERREQTAKAVGSTDRMARAD